MSASDGAGSQDDAPSQDVPGQVRAMVGQSYRIDDVYEVGKAKVSEFANAVQNFHPAHFDQDEATALGHSSLVAPPTFMSLIAFVAQRRMFEETFSCYAMPQILQVDQRFTFHRPLLAGDRLSCEVSLVSARRAVGADLMVVENEIFDQRDQPVLTAATTIAASTDIQAPEDFMSAVEQIMMAGTAPVA
ncbi:MULTISPECIES: FAS1-like dehydratase domain-containing protein [Nocardiaceae]|uniref:FAS1-like dehydratase domain-containing protein n=1 Tax=Nocardiaceae TaxID=85025 RepID=UPI000564FA47|nr:MULTISPECIES: MaoC family dehydratase N-terminal domain-containing protein [Rhodococcus]OZF03524.1 acyl dehydratase [Rhodococcus sp. 15-1189-1-1a]OZF17327.1 acyl dehydratase [Rhodococcus sp. 14-2686-1-2]